MNYVSHHLVARREMPDASPWFYAGNVLPDLLAASGDGRVRGGDLAFLPTAADDVALVEGARLHLECDRQFHGLPAFKAACADVSIRLRAARWQVPPTRVFFVAHALVEIGLDGWILQTQPQCAPDLYRQLTTVGAAPLAEATTVLLKRPLPHFALSVGRFLLSRYLLSYATFAGQATALRNVCRRANLPNFESTHDFTQLVQVLSNVAPLLAEAAPTLLNVPAPVVK